MRSSVPALFQLSTALAVAVAGCASPTDTDHRESDLVAPSPGEVVLMFETPRRGDHHVVTADGELGCEQRVEQREFDVPRGASDVGVSPTAKTLCFTLEGDTFCHVSGTGTGFCRDAWANVVNALDGPSSTVDSRFVDRFLGEHRVGRVIVSGHSQGAYDIARIAPSLRAGDQMVLLQPAAASLTPNRALLDAIDRGVHVHVAVSPGDAASIGVGRRAGEVPIILLPQQDPAIGIHGAANARDLVLAHFGADDDQTFNPALDASILSYPDSQRGPWRFPEWR